MLLEVIAKSLDDVVQINVAGADRIELCAALEVGGLTPDFDLIKKATAVSMIPVNVIVRLNGGWDFQFTKREKTEMLEIISKIAEQTKANGVVIGVLNDNMQIDTEFLDSVMKVKGALQVTFHKAFDQIPDKATALAILNRYEIQNVLTSGGTVLEDNWEILAQLANLSQGTNILIGGGVTLQNIEKCLHISKHIHIGTAARSDGTWNSPIAIEKIKNFKLR